MHWALSLIALVFPGHAYLAIGPGGQASLPGGLTVGSNLTVGGSLAVDGSLEVVGSLAVDSDLAVSGDFYVAGDQFLLGTMQISPRPLHGAQHTAEQCQSLGGTLEVLEEFQGELDFLYGEFCRLNASACPQHWTQAREYSTTRNTTCTTQGACNNNPCTTGSHPWGNQLVETCTYTSDRGTGCRTYTCRADFAEIGCV